MKRLLTIGLLLAALAAGAADLTKGYTFTPTDRVTSTKLNNLVDLATVNAALITGKSAAVPAAADTFLFYSATAAGLRKATFANMARDYTGLITEQSEDTTPATGDWVLTYDITASTFKKAQLMSLIWTNDFLINGRTNWTAPGRATTFLLGYDTTTGGYAKLSRSNLFWQFFEWNTFTNQLEHTAPTNTDRLLIWDSVAGTNKWTSLSGLVTNLPTVTTSGPADWYLVVSNGTPCKISSDSVSNNIAGALVNTVLPRKFVSGESNIVAGSVVNVAHGLSGTPQSVRAVYVCKTADGSFAVGDELDFASMVESTSLPIGIAGANSTNVFCALATDALYTREKTTGASLALTETRWRVKIYAELFP